MISYNFLFIFISNPPGGFSIAEIRFWGKLNKTLGRRFSFTLAFLILVTIFLWSWEDKPLAKSLTSPEKQFVRHTS
ncbi:hypothetical protein Leryth_021486, partial [Lithospermum erythrorhizon]